MNEALKNILGFVSGYSIGRFIGSFIFKDAKANNEETQNSPDQENDEEEEYFDVKDYCAVFIVRKDLKMRRGKIAAQCGHATLAIFRKMIKHYPEIGNYWGEVDFPKQYFYTTSQEDMHQRENTARELGYYTTIIQDAGRTQIEAGSETVLVIGPVPTQRVFILTDGLIKIE